MNSQEYNAKRDEVAEKLGALQKSFDELIKMTSPTWWRLTGTHFMELERMGKDLERLTEISKSELDNDWVKEALKQV
jgi:hypothetical protein